MLYTQCPQLTIQYPTVYSTSKFAKRVDLMLGVLTTKTKTKTKPTKKPTKEQKETPGDAGYVPYLDYGDNITDVCMSPNSSSWTY